MIKYLEKVGFINRGDKGSHRNFLHPSGAVLTISGKRGDETKAYQEKLVTQKIREVQK